MMTDADVVVLTRVITAPLSAVFRAWTDPVVLQQWLAPGPNVVEEAIVDLRVGGTFQLRSRGPDGARHRIDGVYHEIEPDRRIVQSWTYEGPLDLLTGEETLLEITLQPRGDETKLTLTHRRLTEARVRDAYRDDWPTCFDKLERALN